MVKNETMKAGFFIGDRQIELREVPVPSPSAHQVLLKVLACGVCGTDYHILEGAITEGVGTPVVLGHEIVGHVVALGESVASVREGQFCAVDPVLGCGTCPNCRSGAHNLCDEPAVLGYKLDGGFAQYTLVPETKLAPMSESVGAAGGVLCETLACVINGYDKLNLRPGSSAMILGAGTVGLLWGQLLWRSPLSVLIQTELVEFRRRKAEQLGTDIVIDPSNEDLTDRVRSELPGGVDYIIDATGDHSAVEQAIPLLSKKGTFMIFGVCRGGSSVSFDPFEMYKREARIIGSRMPPHTVVRSVRLIESGRIACDEIVTGTFGLDKLAEMVTGFEDHRDTQVKVAIDPWS